MMMAALLARHSRWWGTSYVESREGRKRGGRGNAWAGRGSHGLTRRATMMERDTTIAVRWHRRPALSDIIDEQDEIDFVEGRSDD